MAGAAAATTGGCGPAEVLAWLCIFGLAEGAFDWALVSPTIARTAVTNSSSTGEVLIVRKPEIVSIRRCITGRIIPVALVLAGEGGFARVLCSRVPAQGIELGKANLMHAPIGEDNVDFAGVARVGQEPFWAS